LVRVIRPGPREESEGFFELVKADDPRKGKEPSGFFELRVRILEHLRDDGGLVVLDVRVVLGPDRVRQALEDRVMGIDRIGVQGEDRFGPPRFLSP
jgi:hypothetical protein